MMIPETFSSLQRSPDYYPIQSHEEMSECSPSIDVFQFGHLALSTIIQKPVQPLLTQTYTDEKTRLLHARSELGRETAVISGGS